jgi:Pectate lyase superfamily protein
MKKLALSIVGSFVLTACISCGSLPPERTFPSDSGMLNVKTVFGAVGDGVTDDTAAIQSAISATVHQQATSRILYFPAGTYLVKQPLVWKNTQGQWVSQLTFQGENQNTTIIKLSDNNSAYQNAAAPADVIDTASLEPSSGPDQVRGGGYDGFDNYLFDLTVDVGTGNPGAIALDFIGNNYCGVRNVTLRSSDPGHAGAAGLSMTRAWTGPCMMKNLSIDGFNYGIKSSQTEYSVTFENLFLANQLVAGISNTDNVLSIRNLVSVNKVPAIQNLGSSSPSLTGLVTLIGAILSGGAPSSSAIQNSQTLYARDVITSGYRSAIQDASGEQVPGTFVTEYNSGPVYTLFGHGSSSLNLPIQETPEFEETDLSKWKSVVSLGADRTGVKDSSVAVQAAIDSGATTVYFPAGKYMITTPIIVRGNVRMIEGFDSNILPSGSTFTGATVNPLLVFENTVDVIVSHFRFGPGGANLSYPGLRFMEHESSHSVTIRNTVFNELNIGSVYKNGANGTGPLFLEDVDGRYFEILYPQLVFARQLDMEGPTRKMLNNGGKVWILGLKTEKGGDTVNTAGVIDTESSGSTEVLGGLVYPVTATIPVNQATFVVNDSKASFVYAVSAHNRISTDPSTPDGDFKTQIQEVRAGVVRSLASSTIAAKSPRGTEGVMVPLYTSKP